MNNLKNIILTVKNQDGDGLTLTLAGDSDLGDLVDAFRTVAFWLTYLAGTIDEYLPDGTREWSYDDEREPDEHGPEGDD
jgi:hypothetical protein